jgi:hypothetical protein
MIGRERRKEIRQDERNTIMTHVIPVLDTPEELQQMFNRDVDNLLEMRNARKDEVEVERLNAKANAVESGLIALVRADKAHPGDADAAYCEVIEKFAMLETQATNVGNDDPLHAARLQGRAQGLEHVLYRVRGARFR